MSPLDVESLHMCMAFPCPECSARPWKCCEPLEELVHVSRMEYWPDTLAVNLGIGGALCKAHEVALNDWPTDSVDWHPGCGRTAPFGRGGG